MVNKLTSAWENYYTPDTVAAALDILQRHEGRARVIGGGTDLLVESRRGLRRPLEATSSVTASASRRAAA